MSIDEATFRQAMGSVPTGVSVFTIVDRAGADHGMTVSAFCSVSLHPPLLLACIGDDATIAAVMPEADRFGISVLAEDQEGLSRRFADRDERDFDGVPHVRGPLGTVLIGGVAAQVECRITARHRAGDHTIIVGEVVHASVSDRAPLVHRRGGYARLSPNAR